MNITVAIDCMGGDHGPRVTVPAALRVLHDNVDTNIVLVGLRDALEAELKTHGAEPGPRLRVHHASEVVLMDEPPALTLRGKKDSSMRVAVDLVRSGEAQACVSAGSTGALMAISRFVLKMLPGIDRPAIISAFPTMRGSTYVLDLGANVDCAPENLMQFAIMAATLVSAVERRERPSVGLLNIGEEVIKGNEVVKQTGELLRASGLNFIGNIEGDGIFKGKADIVVCDGFVGNVMLKSSEGLAQMIRGIIQEEFRRSVFTKLAAAITLPVLNVVRRRLDTRQYNGATLLGLKGIVVKSHGSADVFGYECAIERAMDEVRNRVLPRLIERFGSAEITEDA